MKLNNATFFNRVRQGGIPILMVMGMSSLATADETETMGPSVIMNGVEVSPGITMKLPVEGDGGESCPLSASSCSISEDDESGTGGSCSIGTFYGESSSEVPAMPT